MRPQDDPAPLGPDKQLHEVARILSSGLRRLGRPTLGATTPLSAPENFPVDRSQRTASER
jgi:hypothetical protein